MSCKKISFSKILPVVYSVLTILNISRLAYMSGITILVSDRLNEIVPAVLPIVVMHLCAIYIALIHVALIVSAIFVLFEKNKPFYIVAAIDLVVYSFCLIYFESQGSFSEKALVYIPAYIIQAVFFFITISHGYKKKI